MFAPGGALVRGAQSLAKWSPNPLTFGAPAVEILATAQHRYSGGGCRSRIARFAYSERRRSYFRVHSAPLEDRGGGLARVNGQVRLVEGLAIPREETELGLSYYNSNTCWISLDKLLAAFTLTRADLPN